MSDGDVYSRLADIAIALAHASGLDDVCTAVEQGRLSTSSTAPVRAAVAGGNAALEAQLLGLQAAWAQFGPGLSAAALAALLRSCVHAASSVRQSLPTTQVAWTGPKVEGSFLRATREVVRELLRSAERTARGRLLDCCSRRRRRHHRGGHRFTRRCGPTKRQGNSHCR